MKKVTKSKIKYIAKEVLSSAVDSYIESDSFAEYLSDELNLDGHNSKFDEYISEITDEILDIINKVISEM